mmetsp:Transcript_13843/g.30451  ORF Transcript_13843/g.30451 Transcript_13843/m.30451 type:complete len:99 (-) Transcript_13843:512-808(-)
MEFCMNIRCMHGILHKGEILMVYWKIVKKFTIDIFSGPVLMNIYFHIHVQKYDDYRCYFLRNNRIHTFLLLNTKNYNPFLRPNFLLQFPKNIFLKLGP